MCACMRVAGESLLRVSHAHRTRASGFPCVSSVSLRLPGKNNPMRTQGQAHGRVSRNTRGRHRVPYTGDHISSIETCRATSRHMSGLGPTRGRGRVCFFGCAARRADAPPGRTFQIWYGFALRGQARTAHVLRGWRHRCEFLRTCTSSEIPPAGKGYKWLQIDPNGSKWL